MKDGSVVSSGLVSSRTLKERAGPADPMLKIYYECMKSWGKWRYKGRLLGDKE
jgi:hypothetical protein